MEDERKEKQTRTKERTEEKMRIQGKEEMEEEGRKGNKERSRLSPCVTTDGLGSAPCIRLPSDQRLPLTVTFGPPPHTQTQISHLF